MARPEIPERHDSSSTHGFAAALARAYWMLLGNFVVGVSAGAIVQSPRSLSAADAVFWGGALSLIFVRWLDITHLGGTTADGAPATMGDWRRYALLTAAVAGLAWGAAHGIAVLLAR